MFSENFGSKGQLKNTPYFHLVNPADLDSLEEMTEWLEAMLHNPCSVREEDGQTFLYETRGLVARIDGLKIEIYSDEHAPPHFHVRAPDLDASFTIDDCERIAGTVSALQKRKLEHWHSKCKPMLVSVWNSTRPTVCEVGKIRQSD